MSSISELAAQDATVTNAYIQAGREAARAWTSGNAHPQANRQAVLASESALRRLVGLGWEASWWLRGALASTIEVVFGGMSAALKTAESVLGWSLSVLVLPLMLVFQVPYVGRVLHWVLATGLALLALIIKAPDGLLTLLGVLPEKLLKVGFVDLSQAAVNKQALAKSIREAGFVLREQANIRLVVTGPDGAVNRSQSWADLTAGATTIAVAGNGSPLEVGCLGTAFAEDLAPKGSLIARAMQRSDRYGLWRRLVGLGAPVSTLLVDSVQGGGLLGCSLGPLVDYVTVEATDPRCLAHELGHACNLWHVEKKGNLMNPHCGGSQLHRWQVALLRMSRHVSYF